MPVITTSYDANINLGVFCPGNLVKSGTGTLYLQNFNSTNFGSEYGYISLNGGTVKLDPGLISDGCLDHAINCNGGTLQRAPGNSDDLSSAMNISLAVQTAYLDTGANNVTFAHAISGAGGLTKLGLVRRS